MLAKMDSKSINCAVYLLFICIVDLPSVTLHCSTCGNEAESVSYARGKKSSRSLVYEDSDRRYSIEYMDSEDPDEPRGNYDSGNDEDQDPGRSIPETTVLMPDGRHVKITRPVHSKWRCGTTVKKITLNPNGKMGRREYRIVSDQMQNTIMQHPSCSTAGGCFKKYKIVSIKKILNGCAWRKYVARQKEIALENDGEINEKMLFHGSPSVSNVITNGFDERYASASGKLGAGIYFTNHSSAANQFVFGFFGGEGCKTHKDKNCYICTRDILLCRVTLGKSKDFVYSSLGQMSHAPPGFHSSNGVPGEGSFDYPEYVIYRGEQAYPEYEITYKILRPKHHASNKYQRRRH